MRAMQGGAAMAIAVFALSWGAARFAAGADDSRYDDAAFCSKWLADPALRAFPADAHRRCVIAIASTYINAEENSLPPDRQLFADDVSRHHIGSSPDFQPGNKARIIAENSHAVIAKIANRRWTVDGDQAWILYDGYLKDSPAAPAFYVAERITVEKGLIKEILVADVTRAK
jgi:hypothetical protein